MRKGIFAIAAAALLGTMTSAFAQGAAAPAAPGAEAQQVDDAYLAQCSPQATKEFCGCIVSVADFQIKDPTERMIFYAYTVGDFDKAREQRAVLPAEQNMKFNIALQQAETMVHDRCDKLRPQQAPAPK